MKLNSSQRYYLYSIKPAVIIYYIVMLTLSTFSIILNFVQQDANSSFGGIAGASLIFLFIVGICSFSEEFKMFIQNGITRRELWSSFLASSIIISTIMSAIDLISIYLMSLVTNSESLVMMLSSIYVDNVVLKVITTFFIQVLFYTLALALGYFIRLVYYRMNKFGRTTLSIAVPGFFFIALPILSSYYDLTSIFEPLFGFLATVTNPEKLYGLPMFYLLFVLLTIGISLLNKLLIKKAIIT